MVPSLAVSYVGILVYSRDEAGRGVEACVRQRDAAPGATSHLLPDRCGAVNMTGLHQEPMGGAVGGAMRYSRSWRAGWSVCHKHGKKKEHTGALLVPRRAGLPRLR
ncbi:hypothetical protein E2C01_058008 [Portunus trituberculatus]|uniref:Uncharacterized protein n=1 Tax=Portunus trituberculatus TaxID=210409 RepID=A0A5B7H1V5_PORTR|nr:hypothetical protein [Portunus trituberculatus]